MHILRYAYPGTGDVSVGVLTAPGRVAELEGVPSLASLWGLPAARLRERLAGPRGPERDLAEVTLLAPVDGRTEVWACGVTYEISREARLEESDSESDLYARVYEAERPELFFKSAAWRVAGSGAPIGIRADSAVTVPEPEVALIVSAHGEIVGYTICDDVSSRSIEGENPLYLPQAKTYAGGCALGPMIRPAWEITDPYALGIEMAITRGGTVIWAGAASTAQLHRRYDELVSYLMRADVHPDGAVLSTGTCLVPPFTLQEGDTVTITVDEVGTLESPVVRGIPASAVPS